MNALNLGKWTAVLSAAALCFGIWTSAQAEPTLPVLPKSEDGLHVEPWFADSWLDIQDDIQTAEAQGKRLLMIVELRGCAPCTRMHDTTYREPKVVEHLTKYFHVVQLNLIGDRVVTDQDGAKSAEKAYVRQIGVKGTPSYIFYHRPDAAAGKAGADAVAYLIKGYKERAVFVRLLDYVRTAAYETEPDFDTWLAANGNLDELRFD